MSTAETEMTPEPDWLAAQPTARAKLTAIFAAVRRHYSVSQPLADHGGPHIGLTMAGALAGQLLIRVAADERDSAAAWLGSEAAELQRRAQSADPHGPAARRAVRNQQRLAASLFDAAAHLSAHADLLREGP